MIGMDNASPTILLIAGTAEARELAAAIAQHFPAVRLIVSLLGATSEPAAYAGTVRIGGFGGAEGLAGFLRAEGVTHLIDAAHPFAAGIHRNAAAAATSAGVPYLPVIRPEWPSRPGWQHFACLGAASAALPFGSRPFLALGQRHLAPFRHQPDIAPVLRMAEPPQAPLPFAAHVIVGPPARDVEHETALFREYAITHLVCRNSGGDAGLAKLDAAERLGIPVFMIRRPQIIEIEAITSIRLALDWLFPAQAFGRNTWT